MLPSEKPAVRIGDPSITRTDQFVRVQPSATCSRVFRALTDEHGVRRPQLRPAIKEEHDPDVRRVLDEESARPSSLIPVHKPHILDPLHDLQLFKDLQIINERTVRELGPLPPGGLSVQTKRKPKSWNPDAPMSVSGNSANSTEEDETMKISHAVAAAALVIAGTQVALGNGKRMLGNESSSLVSAAYSQGSGSAETVAADPSMLQEDGAQNAVPPPKTGALRDSFNKCMDATPGITYDMMNCMGDELEYQNARLNRAYKRLHETLDPNQWEHLRTRQRQWLANRDGDCRRDSEDMGGGTAEMLGIKMCILEKTAKRAGELEVVLARYGK